MCAFDVKPLVDGELKLLCAFTHSVTPSVRLTLHYARFTPLVAWGNVSKRSHFNLGGTMSKEALSKVIGRAVLDQDFAAKLAKNPKAAAASVNARLSADEINSLHDVSATHMKAVSRLLRQRLSASAFFDQQQQQQQARMD